MPPSKWPYQVSSGYLNTQGNKAMNTRKYVEMTWSEWIMNSHSSFDVYRPQRHEQQKKTYF